MPKKSRRDVLFNVNKMQKKILSPFYASCLFILICLILITSLLKYHPILQRTDSYQTLFIRQLSGPKLALLGFGIVIMFVLFLLIYWAYCISNKILGPYERILKELDSILSTKEKKLLKVRDGDEMFSELLKRINTLIRQKR